MIVGCSDPDSGEVILGSDRVSLRGYAAKRRIGYVPQEIALYEDLNAFDNLRFFAALSRVGGVELGRATDRVLSIVGLHDRAKDPVSSYSGGMKRRLNIAIGLIHGPELLVLDEPTVGVDPQSRNAIFEALEILKSEGVTLIYTTHYMEEVERICDVVAVMDNGKVIACDTLAGLTKIASSAQTVMIELDTPPVGLAAGSPIPILERGNRIEFTTEDLSVELPAVLYWLKTNGLRYRAVQTREASLESVFLELTGRSLRD